MFHVEHYQNSTPTLLDFNGAEKATDEIRDIASSVVRSFIYRPPPSVRSIPLFSSVQVLP